MITAWHLPLYPAIIISIIIAGVLGWLTYQLVFSRMVGVPRSSSLSRRSGSRPRSRNRLPHLGRESFAAPPGVSLRAKQLFGTFFYNDIDEFIVFLAIILCVAVALIIRYTRLAFR